MATDRRLRSTRRTTQEAWRGLALPVTKTQGEYFKSKDVYDLVWGSIVTIIGTPIGSRRMRRDFGSRLTELLFEPNDTALASLAETFIQDAIEKWEKRIVVDEVLVTNNRDHDLHVRIKFRLIGDTRSVTGGVVVNRSKTLNIVKQFFSGS